MGKLNAHLRILRHIRSDDVENGKSYPVLFAIFRELGCWKGLDLVHVEGLVSKSDQNGGSAYQIGLDPKCKQLESFKDVNVFRGG